MTRLLLTVPFTFCMVGMLVAIALVSGTHLSEIAPPILRRHGFAPIHLPSGQWARLVTSVFLTAGGTQFYASVTMLALSLCWVESLHGSGRAFLLFWGIHFATLLIGALAIAIPLHSLRFYHGTLLANAHDVGPSAGYYGCLGAASLSLPVRWRSLISGAILVVLILRFIRSVVTLPDQGRTLSANLAHLIAFLLGLLVANTWLASKL